MKRRAFEATRRDRSAGRLLGADHPLTRAIDDRHTAQRQCAVVAAIMVGCIRPAVGGHTWGVALMAAAAVTLAVLLLAVAVRYLSIRDRALELIAQGQETLAVEAVRTQRQ